MDGKRFSILNKMELFCNDQWEGGVTDEMLVSKFLIVTYPFLKLTVSKCRRHDHGVEKNGACALCEFERLGKVYYPGEKSPRQKAIEAGDKYYIPDTACPKCGVKAKKSVHDGKCTGCGLRNASRSESRKDHVQYYLPSEPCSACGTFAYKRVLDDKCMGCGKKPRRSLISENRRLSLANGEEMYHPEIECPQCGEYALRYTATGVCSNCNGVRPKQRSSRQKAIDAGEKWYTPDTPCPYCGKLEQRYVANGRCKCGGGHC